MSKWLIFLWLSIAGILLLYAFNFLFINENVYYQSYGHQISIGRVEEIFQFSKKWQWISYFVLPILILLRVFFTSTIIYIGIFFTELKIEFGKLFKLALLADFIYVLAGVVKLIFLIFFKEVNTLQDLQFQPLSVMELINTASIDPLFIYPLSLLNVFEFCYFLVLAWLLVGVINEDNEERPVKFGQSFKLVIASYGSGLSLWVLVVMFIILNLS